MTAQNPPIFLQAGSHPAEDVRRWIEAASTAGAVTTNAMLVTANGTPNMSVDIATGGAFIAGTETSYQGLYFAENRGTQNVAIASSDSTNPRIDIVVARIKDAAYSGAANEFTLEAVTGTPAASPGQPATPANSMLLATISVLALSTSVTTAVITDTRTHTRSLHPGGTALLPAYSFADDPDTGLYRRSTNEIGFATGGTESLRLTGNNIRMASGTSLIYNVGHFRGADATGTAASPTYSWNADLDTGMYRDGANEIGFATGGTALFRMDSTALRGNVNYTPSMPGKTAGSAAAPTYSFVNDTDTGMYRSGADDLSLATGGTLALRITNIGHVALPAQYNRVTANAANMYYASNTFIYRATSSAKYKTDVETMGDEFADAILELRPVWYKSLGDHDPESWGYWGLIAEEVAEVDARLVHWGCPDSYEAVNDENGEPVPPTAADMTEPEGVQYERLVPHLINIAARQRDQIVALEARLDAAGI